VQRCKKITLLWDNSNSKCVGTTLYKESDITKERFLEANIFDKRYVYNQQLI